MTPNWRRTLTQYGAWTLTFAAIPVVLHLVGVPLGVPAHVAGLQAGTLGLAIATLRHLRLHFPASRGNA